MRALTFAAVAVLALALLPSHAAAAAMTPQPGVLNCTLHHATQYIDHFTWSKGTYEQRYFVYDKWFAPGGPIFFYTGNEANVELFANWTGLMWENGQEVKALLVFAEHRFFGESMPCKGGFKECGQYLGTEQAMADYATLVVALRKQYAGSSATVAFGGSYGGMLAAWMRMRYPAEITGAIASSAPIGCMADGYKGSSYWAVVSRDATAAGGAAPQCFDNVHEAIHDIRTLMGSGIGRVAVAENLRLCKVPTEAEMESVLLFVQAAFDSMAMGNYPFETYYISGTPGHPAPAWPMRVACEHMRTSRATAVERIAQLHLAISTVDNITKNERCYNTSGLNPSVYSPAWDYMVCTNDLINEQPYFAAAGPPNDMFWPEPAYDHAKLNKHCEAAFGTTPRYGQLNLGLGVDNIAASSNIVFANGLLDPWHSGGILKNVSATVVALIIPEGAHHLDLFFSTPHDPASVIEVRKQQMAHIRQWMKEAGKH
jgi:lysosomal Pro-X carboxypeptidase